MKAFVAALITLALVPVAASAKEGIELSSLPDFLTAGEPWNTEIRSLPTDHGLPATHGVAIQITNEKTGQTLDFPAAPNGDGSYRVRVVFPSAGRWDYEVVGLGNYPQQDWAPVDIAAPATPAPAADRDSGSFPWGWVGGGGGALTLALAAVFMRRYRPWRSSPSSPSADPPPSSS
jgi:hypothetical protein